VTIHEFLTAVNCILLAIIVSFMIFSVFDGRGRG
jgi:hypothetical protein